MSPSILPPSSLHPPSILPPSCLHPPSILHPSSIHLFSLSNDEGGVEMQQPNAALSPSIVSCAGDQ